MSKIKGGFVNDFPNIIKLTLQNDVSQVDQKNVCLLVPVFFPEKTKSILDCYPAGVEENTDTKRDEPLPVQSRKDYKADQVETNNTNEVNNQPWDEQK